MKNLTLNEEKLRDLHLRKLALGELQGPPVGKASIDKPWLKHYSSSMIDVDIEKKTCYQALIENNKNRLENIAIEYFGRKITYQQLLREIDKTAAAYVNLGIRKGDIVTFLAVNSPEVVYSFYALNKIGAISNMIDPRSNAKGIEKYINEVNSSLVVTLDLCYPNVVEAIKNTNVKNVVVFSATNSIPFGLKLVTDMSDKFKEMTGTKAPIEENDTFIKWNNFIANAKKDTEIDSIPYIVDYPAVIVHTGGTTGNPKGVLLSNDNFNAVVCQVKNSPIGMVEKDKFLNILVPFVAYGLALGLHAPMTLGWDSILIPKFEPKDIVKLMNKHKPAGVMGIATYYESLLSHTKYDYSHSKAILMGGMPTKEEFEKNINKQIKKYNGNFQISKGYSMTEASSCATCSYTGVNEIGSNGVPLVKTIVSAFDPETGVEKGYNEPGEICIFSPTRMLEYFNNEDATNQVLKKHDDGRIWIHSGDIGYVTENGYVYIIDRIKRMIIRSGFKVFPSEIENAFLKHNAIESCAVVGIDDVIDNKAPKAYIVLKEQYKDFEQQIQRELSTYIEKHGLPSYFSPVEYEFRDKLPLTNIGKIDFVALENENKVKQKGLK